MYWPVLSVNVRSIWSRARPGHWEPPTDFIVSNWNMQRRNEYISSYHSPHSLPPSLPPSLYPVRRLTSQLHIYIHISLSATIFGHQTHCTLSDFISFQCENNDGEFCGNYQPVNSLSEQAQFATNTWDNQVLAKSAAFVWSRAEWNSNVLMIAQLPHPSALPCRNSWSVWLRWTQPVGWIVKPIWFSNKLQPCWSDSLYFNEGNWWLGLELSGDWRVETLLCKEDVLQDVLVRDVLPVWVRIKNGNYWLAGPLINQKKFCKTNGQSWPAGLERIIKWWLN